MGDVHSDPCVPRWSPAGDVDDLMTVYQAAAALSISKLAVYRLIECGELEWIRCEESIRIQRRSVDLLLREAR